MNETIISQAYKAFRSTSEPEMKEFFVERERNERPQCGMHNHCMAVCDYYVSMFTMSIANNGNSFAQSTIVSGLIML